MLRTDEFSCLREGLSNIILGPILLTGRMLIRAKVRRWRNEEVDVERKRATAKGSRSRREHSPDWKFYACWKST